MASLHPIMAAAVAPFGPVTAAVLSPVTDEALIDLSLFAAQCAEHVRRGKPADAVARELLAKMARCRGLIIELCDERTAA